MCTDPIVIDKKGTEVACRKCNECLSVRKLDWAARCCAELSTLGNALVIELTYAPKSCGNDPIGARAFRYRDVQLFLKRLRQAYYRRHKERLEMSYIVCGERGADRDRTHWHCILFSDKPITDLGKWTDMANRPMKAMRPKYRCHWSFWKEGLVFPRGGSVDDIFYALKYILKDQFSEENSKGSARYHKSEVFAASMFRMSKAIPIGFRWLEALCDRLEAQGSVLPNLFLNVPGMKATWFPKWSVRQYLLLRMHYVGKTVNERTARYPPQWASLVDSVAGIEGLENDLEVLLHGRVIEATEKEPQNFADYIQQYHAAILAAGAKQRAACAHLEPCPGCRERVSDEEIAAEHRYWSDAYRRYWVGEEPSEEEVAEAGSLGAWYFARHRRRSRFCRFGPERRKTEQDARQRPRKRDGAGREEGSL